MPIWRRLRMRSNSSIATLHKLLHIALDWSDFHLLCATPSSNWNLTLSNLFTIGPPARINLASDKSVV
jgi:Plasmid pRiA4b ORF-3-like protein